MHSPPHTPPPYGSSRAIGGILHGQAVGNTLNAADYHHQPQDILHPVMGKVLVYGSKDNPANLSVHDMKPILFIKHEVTSSIQPILTKVAAKYSPIRSKYCYYSD
jgi:hypothetical protein